MVETAADIVARLAAEHGVEIDTESRAYLLAKGSSRLAGIEGDKTLDLLAELSRRELVPREQAVELILRHAKETGGDADAMHKRHLGMVKGGLVEWLLSCPAEPEDLPVRRGTGACLFDPREDDKFDKADDGD